MDYMAETIKIFDALENEAIGLEDGSIEQILKVKDLIAGITAEVTQLEWFHNSKEKYEAFLTEIRKMHPDRSDRVRKTWVYFLVKFATAPSRLHLKGAVIFCIPAINQMIIELQEVKECLH